MTLMEFREKSRRLAEQVTDPTDCHELQLAIKNVTMYRVIGQVDEVTVERLVAKYPPVAPL